MQNGEIQIKTGKDILASEITALRRSVNCDKHGSCADVERSMEAYPFTAMARNKNGELVGYVSAFSDGVYTTMIGELLVRPDCQRHGIGAALLKRVELRYPGVSVTLYCDAGQQMFFARQGYTSNENEMFVMTKDKTLLNERVISWATG